MATHMKWCDPLVRFPSFWAQVKKGPGCWLWTGWKQNAGYGETSLGGRKITVHRVSYMLAYGPIPKGKLVMHTCDVPLCVRPEHLRLGTDADNTADKLAKDRHAGTLRAAQVREIKAALKKRYFGIGRDLALKYGVSQVIISQISRGVTYRWVS